MSRKRKALVLFALGIALLLPALSYAQNAAPASGGGLVPCGVIQSTFGSNAEVNTDAATECQACHLVQLTQNIINFLVGLTISIGIIMIAWAGILYFTAGARPANIEKGKRIFGQALLGFTLAVGAWIVVNTVLFTLLDPVQYPESSWFHIECVSQDDRLRNATLGDILNGYLGVIDLPELPDSVFIFRPPDGDPGFFLCEEGFQYSMLWQTCLSPEGDDRDPLPYVPGEPGFDTPPDGSFAYASGIASQVSHASPRLTTLLSCMAAKVPGNVGLITSISDSQIVSGGKTWQYCAQNGQGGGCAHVANSCHYGGRTCVGQSYAVDFGDDENSLLLIQAANECGATAEVHNGNHVHASVGSGCGCQ